MSWKKCSPLCSQRVLDAITEILLVETIKPRCLQNICSIWVCTRLYIWSTKAWLIHSILYIFFKDLFLPFLPLLREDRKLTGSEILERESGTGSAKVHEPGLKFRKPKAQLRHMSACRPQGYWRLQYIPYNLPFFSVTLVCCFLRSVQETSVEEPHHVFSVVERVLKNST